MDYSSTNPEDKMSINLSDIASSFANRQYHAPASLIRFFEVLPGIECAALVECRKLRAEGSAILHKWKAAYSHAMTIQLQIPNSTMNQVIDTLDLKLFFRDVLWCFGYNMPGFTGALCLTRIFGRPAALTPNDRTVYQTGFRYARPDRVREEIPELLMDFFGHYDEMKQQREGLPEDRRANLLTAITLINSELDVGCSSPWETHLQDALDMLDLLCKD